MSKGKDLIDNNYRANLKAFNQAEDPVNSGVTIEDSAQQFLEISRMHKDPEKKLHTLVMAGTLIQAEIERLKKCRKMVETLIDNLDEL